MPNQITHKNPLTESKVNFFADYFDFAVSTLGINDNIEVENGLSVIDKIIFQLEHNSNSNRCIQYINSYLTHPSFTEYKGFKEFKSFKNLHKLLKEYHTIEQKPKKRHEWIEKNPTFSEQLKLYRGDLRRYMFKKALKEVKSFLICKHDLEYHKGDVIKSTDILVTEFLLSERSKKDIGSIIRKIMSNEIHQFPFPKSIQSLEEKEDFLQNRNFHQQFDGIYNELNKDYSKSYFMFRIYGLKTDPDFSFTYNQVSFYNYNHTKFSDVKVGLRKKNNFLSEFFKNNENMVIAVVKSKYRSLEIAKSEAIETIAKELRFLNRVCGANCYIEKLSFLMSDDFKNFGGRKSFNDLGQITHNFTIDLLNDNPFNFLKSDSINLKDTILKNEYLLNDALTTKNISTYWQYLETIIPKDEKSNNQILAYVSHILLLNADSHYKNRLKGYFFESIYPSNGIPSKNFGITTERHQELLKAKKDLDWEKLKNEIKHPFLNYLLSEITSASTKHYLEKKQKIYMRILRDAQAQRNAIMHSGIACEKSLISLNAQLPRLITRLRWLIFDGIKKKKGNTYEEIIEKLFEEGKKMIA